MQVKKQWKQFPWKYFLFLYGGGLKFFSTIFFHYLSWSLWILWQFRLPKAIVQKEVDSPENYKIPGSNLSSATSLE